jgi:DNA repair exonuclease SbcCD ATPase subunit
MVLKDAIQPLNREARRVSSMMTGNTIEVVYGTRRELASGQEKAELVIEVNNTLGSKELAGSSKGESGLTNLIIAETLAEVGQVSRRIGFKWLDEVLPHQDQTVCKSIYSHLRELANQLGILIFLVDHNPTAANYADHMLVVEKSREDNRVFSSVKWR